MLDKYEVFTRVAESKNITKVAEMYNYSQSAISHSIQSLEKELGVNLITRTKNGIALTDSGEQLLPDFRRLVQDREILMQRVNDICGFKKGTLKVGAFTSVSMAWIPSVVRRINEDYPEIQVFQSHSAYKGIIQEIDDGIVEIGFLTDCSKGDLDFIPLYKDRYLIVLPPDDPLCEYEKIPIQALNGRRFISMDEGGEYDSYQIHQQVKDARIIHYVNEDCLAVPLVEQGLGTAILPSMILDTVKTNAVVKDFANPRYRTIGIAAKSMKDISPLAKLFIDLTKEYVQKWSQGSEEEF